MSVFDVRRPLFRGSINQSAVLRLVLEKTNALRHHYGARPVEWQPLLADVALAHSRSMATHGFFDHTGPNGDGPGDRMRRLHPELVASVGENLAQIPLSDEQRVADELCARWMASLGHRVNLLDSRFTHVGLAAHVLGPYLLVTQLFGEVVAHVLSPRPPFRIGTEPTLIHVRLFGGSQEVWVRSPRSTEKFDVGFGRSAHGAYPLALERRGATHVAMFSPRSGLGDYQLLIGPSSDRLLMTGVRLCVR